MLTRLQMEVKNVYDDSVELFFHTERRGNELAPAKVRKGYTVTILYAHQHAFAFGEPGIRHEDPQLINVIAILIPNLTHVYSLMIRRQVFPVSLPKLRELNNRVQKFSTSIDGIRSCHGCVKKAVSLNKCGKCSSFWYRNKVSMH
jgi:hypothetical protein